jgi:heme/copper-type cytochrome/quinol oxidase subunit 4
MNVALAAGVATFFGLVWWGLNSLRILPTVRMLLMFVVGCGVSYAVGSLVLRAFGVITGMTGALPAWVNGAIVVVPAGLAAVAVIYLVYHLHPKNRPDKRAEYFALSLPVLALFIGGTLGAATGTLRNSIGDTASQMKAGLVGNSTSQHAGTHHHKGGK